jgi:DnaJ family protein C protein 13
MMTKKQKTREELRDTVENEIRSFNIDKDLGQGHVISWNYSEFEVPYNCLADEIKIGEYYLRILLECGSVSYDTIEIKNPSSFFNDLYHRFLLSVKVNMKCMCLQAMTIVYTKCHEEIGPFADTKYIVGMLDKATDKLERDRLLLFIEALILHKMNIKDVLDANGVRILVDLVTLAHLHKNRAYVPTQTNVIEASPDMERESEKEWYYGNKQGPCSFKDICSLFADSTIDNKTKCWAQGKTK